ncbi:Uncharacterised protein [Vibrio cholerae]|nr:Uncharacterised protein [Vibrio cholerae]
MAAAASVGGDSAYHATDPRCWLLVLSHAQTRRDCAVKAGRGNRQGDTAHQSQ